MRLRKIQVEKAADSNIRHALNKVNEAVQWASDVPAPSPRHLFDAEQASKDAMEAHQKAAKVLRDNGEKDIARLHNKASDLHEKAYNATVDERKAIQKDPDGDGDDKLMEESIKANQKALEASKEAIEASKDLM